MNLELEAAYSRIADRAEAKARERHTIRGNLPKEPAPLKLTGTLAAALALAEGEWLTYRQLAEVAGYQGQGGSGAALVFHLRKTMDLEFRIIPGIARRGNAGRYCKPYLQMRAKQ